MDSLPPLILVTNDDGVNSAGLWSAVEVLLPLGDVWVVAPSRQWSGAARSMPRRGISWEVQQSTRQIAGRDVPAFSVDVTPALCVVYAMLQVLPRDPALLVSGINFGENISSEVTISGTVGAALEGAAYEVPALAVSLEMPIERHHLVVGLDADYRAAQHFTHYFARQMLTHKLPFDADVLNVNVPSSATEQTPWRLTRLSRLRYFHPQLKDPQDESDAGYAALQDLTRTSPDSDIWAMGVDRVVSVTPLSMDLTSRADFGEIEELLRRAA